MRNAIKADDIRLEHDLSGRIDPEPLIKSRNSNISENMCKEIFSDGQDGCEKVTHRVFLECIKHTDTGARYRVTYKNEVLLESSRDPEHDAARALINNGITGTQETWRQGATFATTRLDIEDAARWRIIEGSSRGLRRVRWNPFPM